MPHPVPADRHARPGTGHTGRYPVGQDGPVTEPGSRRPERPPGAPDDAAGDPEFPWPAAGPTSRRRPCPGRRHRRPHGRRHRRPPPPTTRPRSSPAGRPARLPAAAGTRPAGSRGPPPAAAPQAPGADGDYWYDRPDGRDDRRSDGSYPERSDRPGYHDEPDYRPPPRRARRRAVPRPSRRLPRAATVATPSRRRVLRPWRVPRRVSGRPVRRLRLSERPAVPRRCLPAGPAAAPSDVPRPAVPRRAVRRAAGARAARGARTTTRRRRPAPSWNRPRNGRRCRAAATCRRTRSR